MREPVWLVVCDGLEWERPMAFAGKTEAEVELKALAYLQDEWERVRRDSDPETLTWELIFDEEIVEWLGFWAFGPERVYVGE